MDLVYLTDDQKNLLNDFISRNSPRSFLQTYQWGEFQNKVGKDILRLGVFDDNSNLVFAAMAILSKLKFKNYIYCPFGPVFDNSLSEDELNGAFELFLTEVEKFANKNDSIFLKIDPLFQEEKEKIKDVLKKYNFKKSFREIQPRKTLILSLRGNEDEILGRVKSKTRYNINLSIRKGVRVVEGDINDFEELFGLLDQTARKNGFYLHPKGYYLEMLQEFLNENRNDDNNSPFIKIFFAKLENKFVAAAVVLFFAKNAVYLHGGSDYDFRSFFPSTLLHWEIIKRTKSMGYQYYDFWGIDSGKWAGFSRFKKGFGGEEISYAGAYDLVFKPVYYNIYKLLSLLRK